MASLNTRSSHMGLILPLCTTSATLGLTLFQYPVFYSFLQPNNPPIAGRALSAFWDPLLKQGGALIAGLSISSVVAGAVSARWLRTHQTLETTGVSNWYIYGTIFAAGHLVLTPFIARPVQRMIAARDKFEAEAESTNREEMKTWFSFHTARLLLLDLPALWCFAEGVATSFWVI